MSSASTCWLAKARKAWKAKYGGIDVSDSRRLKTLETENTRLKKLLADSMLDVSILKDLLGKP